MHVSSAPVSGTEPEAGRRRYEAVSGLGPDMPVTVLRGVGEQRAKALQKLGLRTLGDLLRHYPRDYIDLTAPKAVMNAVPGEVCAVRAQVYRKLGETVVKGGMKLYKVQTGDDSGALEIVFFNNKYGPEKLKLEQEYLFYGKVEQIARGRAIHNPQVFSVEDNLLSPCYPLTKGVYNATLLGLIKRALPAVHGLADALPEGVRREYGLMGCVEAVRGVHLPGSASQLFEARRRLMFEELFVLAAGVGVLRTSTQNAAAIPMEPHSMESFYKALPFTLTNAQRRAIADLVADMKKTVPANRLIQGDVGSGKTMVAAAGAYFAYLSGAQTALMAPTELLARQHYEGLSPLLGKLGMRLGLLTGAMSAARKREVYAALEAGEIHLCVGTHALLSKGVSFSRLGLVVTDEQHRFGVAQRASLNQKGSSPHTLVMSATPIPRTLALMIYGELELSVIDELPPGRKPVKTFKISSPKRQRAFGFLREHLKKGLQAYIVCPLVEAADGTPPGLRDAVAYLGDVKKAFPEFSVGLLHGKMRSAEKERTMAAFSAGEIQLLVSTTVIEVGVDVPNAVIMMIENAERFGLSQLHQLRGRVGRGKEESFCILLSDSRSPDTLARLRMMCETNDGFRIAEYDLQTRGPGNFLGKQQHGLPEMRIADLATDTRMVAQAQAAAAEVLRRDPLLQAPENAPLRAQVREMMKSVGDRPN